MKNKIKYLTKRQNDSRLKKLGIALSLLKSCWCADCKNVTKLPNCPQECNGGVAGQLGNPTGRIQDENVNLMGE